MTAESAIEQRVQALLEAPIAGTGCRLLEVVFRHEGRWVLRLVIDREPPVTLDVCGAVSELAGRILDVEDPVPHAFALEVTSPGVFRLLKERKHFEQSIGKVCRFTIAPGVLPERKERTVRGVIEAVSEDAVAMNLAGERFNVPLHAIRSARWDPEL